jgi:hypothetical protein
MVGKPAKINDFAASGASEYEGAVVLDYAPESDNEPDPGEVVWAWVPYEEDPSIGKDRPLLVIGRSADDHNIYVALMLSSRNHEHDSGWVYLGEGSWDIEHRESWVRCDRLLQVREGTKERL